MTGTLRGLRSTNISFLHAKMGIMFGDFSSGYTNRDALLHLRTRRDRVGHANHSITPRAQEVGYSIALDDIRVVWSYVFLKSKSFHERRRMLSLISLRRLDAFPEASRGVD